MKVYRKPFRMTTGGHRRLRRPLRLLMTTMLMIGTLGLLSSCAGSSHPQVTLHLQTGRDIVLELYPEKAPNTVDNFLSLANSGFYAGKTFSRAIAKRLIACDALGADGTYQEVGYRIAGEFADAGFAQNDLKHEAGVVTMARENAQEGRPASLSYDTAAGAFMILSAESSRMDGLYAAFGRVISGMDEVDRIAASALEGERLLAPVTIVAVEVAYKGYKPGVPETLPIRTGG